MGAIARVEGSKRLRLIHASGQLEPLTPRLTGARIVRCRRFRLLLRRPGGPLFASLERATIGLSGPCSVLAVDTSIPR